MYLEQHLQVWIPEKQRKPLKIFYSCPHKRILVKSLMKNLPSLCIEIMQAIQHKYLYIETWGCQMNTYDSQRICDLLYATHELIPTEKPEDADVLLMNTCSIREKASEKVFSMLGRWRDLKKEKHHVLLGVGGCVASQEGQEILKRAPYVDIIFGPQTLHRLPFLINQSLKTQKTAIDIRFPSIEKFDNLPAPSVQGPSAYVTIQEGCSKYCKYCIVPYTRGEEVNRPFEDVLADVYHLANQGVKEVTLLGQNVNAYRGPTFDNEIADLGVLIVYVSKIPGIERIRFTTSHPTEFNDSLLNAYANIPQLASHLHLPVQSGSDSILKKMGRMHSRDFYLRLIDKVRKARPGLSITTDFIVGYPGETDQDFQDTLDLVEKVQFDYSYSFSYSPRPGTIAAQLAELIPEDIKKDRLAQLQKSLQIFGKRYTHSLVNTTQRVLVTGPCPDQPGYLLGKTDQQRDVSFKGPLEYSGHIAHLHITEVLGSKLTGKALNVPVPTLA